MSKKPKEIKTAQKQFTLSNLWIKLLLVGFTFVLYGNSISHQFTLDDDVFFTNHSSVQKGIKGIPELFTHGSLEKFDGAKGLQPYRPITLLSFALEKQIFGNGATVAHLINLILYALVLVLLFNLLLKLFKETHRFIIVFIVLLYAAHPIHTEVVASVKSRDELLSALFCIVSLYLSISSIHNPGLLSRKNILGLFCFGLAVFSKESAVALGLIFPISFFILQKQTLKKSVINSVPYLAIALFFIGIRHLVIGNQVSEVQVSIYQNVLYGAGNFWEALATKFAILFNYIKLLFLPWPLSWDYSFNQIPLVGWNAVLPWISVLIYAGILVFSIINYKNRPAIIFGILFYLIMLTPASNLLFINGTPLAERFLFLPSLGFAIAILFVFIEIFKINSSSFTGIHKTSFVTLIAIIILVYSAMTMSRSGDWKSNLTLFESGVEAAPKSSRTHAALANEYRLLGEKDRDGYKSRAYLNDAIHHYNESIEILPSNTDALYNLGVTYTEVGDTDKAIMSYTKTLELDSTHLIALNNMGVIYANRGNLNLSIIYLKRSFMVDSNSLMAAENLALIYYLNRDYTNAIQYGKSALRINSKSVKALGVIRDAYKGLGDEVEFNNYQSLINRSAK